MIYERPGKNTNLYCIRQELLHTIFPTVIQRTQYEKVTVQKTLM